MMGKLLVFIAMLVLLGVHALQAQETPSKKRRGGSGSFNIGMQFMDMEPLNDVIEPSGYEALSNANIQIGGGGQSYFGPVVLGLRGGFVGQSAVERDDYQLSFGGGHLIFSGGYNVLDRDRLLVYPALGIGLFAMGIEQRPLREGTDFDDVIQNPNRHADQPTSIGSGSGLLELALHSDYFLDGDQKAGYGLMLGASAGYRLASEADFFNPAGTELDNTPDFNPGGFFFSLRIGGGYHGTEDRDD